MKLGQVETKNRKQAKPQGGMQMQAGGQGRRCQKGMAGGAKFPDMHPKARRKREQGKKPM